MNKNSRLTFFLVAANFAGGLAGAGVIAKGLHSIGTVPGFRADSMLAYLVGTLISLGGILYLKKFIIRLGGWISLAGVGLCFGLTKLLSLAVTRQSVFFSWAAFAGLCVFFCVVFVPRTFRSDLAARVQGRLSWVELGYNFGVLLGLFLWQQLPSVTLSDAIVFSGGALLVAALLDFATRRAVKDEETLAPFEPVAQAKGLESSHIHPAMWEYVWAIVLLTLVSQIVVLRMSSMLNDTLPYVCFEIGVLIGPLAVKAFRLAMTGEQAGIIGSAVAYFGRGKAFPSVWLVIVSLFASTLGAYLEVGFAGESLGLFLASLFIVVGASSYEAFAIIGFESVSKLSSRPGMVAVTFGVMAITSMIFYAVLIAADVSAEALPLTMLAVVGLSIPVLIAVRATTKMK